ncbi:hybrid sensor histidine kinase/response regulator transcription factor [Labilibacter marinus]|uniref:hybrid sensor histidine kinase/response regulator transcription factor n=1 Tax=Labilibacter marinus TaxID=1477105 RepID=UPI0008351946|nr:two-component regulator propeller domain-containing protein [Labilibacter marinus]
MRFIFKYILTGSWLVFGFLLISQCSYVQGQNYNFESLTTRQGLSQNDVNCVFQDSRGFLWIGTNDGLNRYDGYECKIYRVDPLSDQGISSNLIFDIAEDAQGNLWLGTSDEGICMFDVKKETFTVIKNSADQPALLATNIIATVVPTSDGKVWVGGPKGIDILSLDSDTTTVKHLSFLDFTSFKKGDITKIIEDDLGRIWVGTLKGLYVISVNSEKLEVFTLNASSYVRDFIIDNHELYVAYLHGIFKLEINWPSLRRVKTTPLNSLNAGSIIKDKIGDIYAGTLQGMFWLKKSDKDNVYNQPVLLRDKSTDASLNSKVKSLCEDKFGNVWMGTSGGGVKKYNRNRQKFRHYNKTDNVGSLSYNKVRAISEDSQGNLWIGTDNGGVSFLSHKDKNNYESGFKTIDVNAGEEDKSAISISDIGENGQPEIIVGTGYPSVVQLLGFEDGEVVQKENTILSKIDNEPFAIVKGANKDVWVGTYGKTGLYRYVRNESAEELITYLADGKEGSISSSNIRSLLLDATGNLWVGTDKGLNFLSKLEQLKSEPKFKVYKKEKNNSHSLSHNYILPIFQSYNGTIWIGTMGGGLNKLIHHDNPDSIKFERITSKDGLPNDVVKGILEDDNGHLWISSNRGITQYNPQENSFSNFDINDGLQDYEFGELACCRRADGEMLFGGVNGINAFYPQNIIKDTSTPDVVLTDFQILNHPVNPGEILRGRVVLNQVIDKTESVKLKYAENSFSIRFASLHFLAPNKNQYKYKLEGFDAEWVKKNADDRIAKYTNLKPGDYSFQLLASNSDGVWTTEPKVLHIKITPPWYLSQIAQIAYIIVIVLLLMVFRRYSLIRVKLKNNLLMEHFETEKIKELSQMKLQFFTNISHEFRTPLTLIIGPLEKLMQKGEVLSKSRIAASYALMHRNAGILLKLINQLIDFRKHEQGKLRLQISKYDMSAFLQGMFTSFKEMAELKHIDFVFSGEKDKLEMWFDEDKMERIMYNLLSNAFKFTPENGRVEVILNSDEANDVLITVKDTGVGIPKKMQKHIFERFYQVKQTTVGGAGIGLSFIKGLVDLHQGELTFISEEGEGTSFILKLKKGNKHFNQHQIINIEKQHKLQDVLEVEEGTILIQEITEEEESVNKETILVVEDNLELRSFIKESLTDDYKVLLASHGKEGLEQLLNNEVDLVVSDVMMPEMNGFELCQSIKKKEDISHIPIVLLTAKSEDESRIKSYKVGADAYVSKPFSVFVLHARIKNLIESRNLLRRKLENSVSIEPSAVTTTSMDAQFLKRVIRIVDENIPNPEFTVEQLAHDYGMSQVVFHKKIKGLTGQTPKVFIRGMRLKRAAQLLAMDKYTISDVTYEVGFSDLKYFRNCFKDKFGLLPKEYAKQNRANKEE